MQKHREKKGLFSIEPEKLILDDQFDRHSIIAADYDKKYNRKHWAKLSDLSARARYVDDRCRLQESTGIILEEVYHTLYRWSSELVHGYSSGIMYYSNVENSRRIIDIGPNRKNINIVLPATNRMLNTFIFLVNHIMHLECDTVAQLKCSGLMPDVK